MSQFFLYIFFILKPFSFLKVENECGEIPTVIVQNKIDLIDQATVAKYALFYTFQINNRLQNNCFI